MNQAIIEYDGNTLRDFATKCNHSYEKNQTVPLLYNDFRANAYNLMYKYPKPYHIDEIPNKTHIAIAPSTRELLRILEEHSAEMEDIQLNAPSAKKDLLITQLCKKLFVPKYEFDYSPPIVDVEYNGITKKTPMWFNTTMKGINIRLGYDRGDSATPSAIVLGDNVVHMMLGGATGAGKSVALNTLECNLIVEYPPWELDIYLGDFKKVEGARYANRIPTPHMKIVAATGSTEFILSMYKEIIKEMNDRQAIFAKTGVQKLEDFRKKFGLVVPRVLLVVDEFTQMYENIKASERAGNDNAAEDKKEVDSALSDIARLGRSMGIHMCLSSQQLDNLDQGVANQFAAGATLKAPPAVSTSLIGNDAGATIRGKGKGYYNINKAEKKASDNVLVRIPFLNSEQSEEDAAAGKLTNLQEILQQAYDNAKHYKYDKGLVFYDEDAPIPAQKYREATQYLKDVVAHRKKCETVEDSVFTKTLVSYLPLGPEIKLSPEPVVPLHLIQQKNGSIVVHATDPKVRNYILQLLGKGFQNMNPDASHVVINANESIYRGGHLDTLPNLSVKTRPILPADLQGKVNTRKAMIDLQGLFNDTGNGDWDDNVVWEYLSAYCGRAIKSVGATVTRINEIVHKALDIYNSGKDPGTEIEEFKGSYKDDWLTLFNTYNYYHIPFVNLRAGGEITLQRLPMIVVWLTGLDNFTDIEDSEIRRNIKSFLEQSSMVNVICVVTADTWTKVGSVVENTNYVLERCDKSFFMDIGLPKSINANPNSFQLHNRNLKTKYICSMYSGLE